MAISYSLTVLDLGVGTTLVPPTWRAAWPLLPDLSAIRASQPSLPISATPTVLRAEIALRHNGGCAVLRQEWLGYWNSDAMKIEWRELDDEDRAQPRIVLIRADLDCFCVWDQYGSFESLPITFPDIPGLPDLEHQLECWAGHYDKAYAGGGAVRANMKMNWDSFNRDGLRLTRQLKALLGGHATVFYEKSPWDATDSIDEVQLVE